MYRPTTRVLAAQELLQAHRQLTGRELAARLEVHLRTARRYVEILQDLGIPVEVGGDRTAGTGCARTSSCRRSCSPTPRRQRWCSGSWRRGSWG